MISGTQTLASVENAIVDLRRSEDQLGAALQSATEEAARLRQQQLDAYKALARVRLDAIAGNTITGKLDATETRARDLLARRSSALNDEARQRARAFDAVTAALARRHAAGESHEAALKAMDDQRAATQARMAEDATWRGYSDAIETARNIVVAAEKKAEASQQDLAQKRKPFEDDPLFVYLWQRQFATARYASTGLTRFLDRQVAAFIGYDVARTDYALLQEMPVRLAEHAARCKDKAQAAEAARTAYERKALEADGIAALEKQLEAALRDVAAADAALKTAREAQSRLDAGKAAGNAHDAAYEQALQLLGEAIAHDDLRTLYKEALQTPTTDDEEIVRQLQALADAIARADKDVADTRETMRQAASRRAQMELARDDFNSKGYNDPYVSFRNDSLIAEILGGIVRGVLQGTQLGGVLHDGYTRQQPRSNPWFGGGSSDNNWSGSVWGGGGGSGGDSGGSSGSGGGDNDGFTTGGSF